MAARASNSGVIVLAFLTGAVAVVVTILNSGGPAPNPTPTQPAGETSGDAHATGPEAFEPAVHEDADGLMKSDIEGAQEAAEGDDPAPEDTEGPPLSSLAASALTGDLDGIGFALAGGADVNERAPGGGTPLMLAAGAGQLDAVFALLNAGADAALRDDERRAARDHALSRFDEQGRVIARILEDAVGIIPVTDPTNK